MAHLGPLGSWTWGGGGSGGAGAELGRLYPNPSSTRHQAASGGLSSLLGAVGPSRKPALAEES